MSSRSEPPTTTPRPLGKAFRGLVISFGISAIGFGAMAPFLVVWGHRDAGLAGAAAGLLFVAQAAGELTGGLAGGLLADRVGGRHVRDDLPVVGGEHGHLEGGLEVWLVEAGINLVCVERLQI